MKKAIVEKEIGGDGAKAGLYVDEEYVSLSIKYPTVKLVEPIAQLADKAIDKVDALIPGDQTAEATAAKAKLREELAKLFASQANA